RRTSAAATSTQANGRAGSRNLVSYPGRRVPYDATGRPASTTGRVAAPIATISPAARRRSNARGSGGAKRRAAVTTKGTLTSPKANATSVLLESGSSTKRDAASP